MGGRIRIGILSFAHFHANFWSEVFRESPLAEFVGIWDDNPGRGAGAAQLYGVPFWSDLGALLEACDAVGITLMRWLGVSEMVESAVVWEEHP
jgi:predicted dehydrogenase